jgi:hypothetical protein
MMKVITWGARPVTGWDRVAYGKFRAHCQVVDGQIVKATLYQWRVVRYVCFGNRGHDYGWLPTGDVWKARTDVRTSLTGEGVSRFGMTDVEPFKIATIHSPGTAIFRGGK